MDFGYSPTVEQWRVRVQALLDEVVYPAEPTFHEQVQAQGHDQCVGSSADHGRAQDPRSPLDTPGVHVERSTHVLGFTDAPHGGHRISPRVETRSFRAGRKPFRLSVEGCTLLPVGR
jgi:hypothetical protein